MLFEESIARLAGFSNSLSPVPLVGGYALKLGNEALQLAPDGSRAPSTQFPPQSKPFPPFFCP